MRGCMTINKYCKVLTNISTTSSTNTYWAISFYSNAHWEISYNSNVRLAIFVCSNVRWAISFYSNVHWNISYYSNVRWANSVLPNVNESEMQFSLKQVSGRRRHRRWRLATSSYSWCNSPLSFLSDFSLLKFGPMICLLAFAFDLQYSEHIQHALSSF